MSNKKELFNWSDLPSFIVLLFISAISLFHLYISTQNQIVGLVADDAIYLLMTDYFSPYYRSLSSSAAFVMGTSQFPPLYPIFLAVLGASSESVWLAHIITTSCLIASLVVYVLWITEDRASKRAGLCLALIFISSPASLLMNIDLWSEHLYLFLTMVALFLVTKASKDNNYWFVAAFVIGLLPVARLVGVTFLAAFFVYLHLNKINFRYRYIAVSIAPLILWKAISLNLYSSEIYKETLTQFYQYDLWLHIKHLFLSQLPDLWSGWHECFDNKKNNFSGIVAAFILATSLYTWCVRLLKKQMDSLYLLFYLLLVLIWPDPDHNMRFIFVVLPVFLYYSYLFLLPALNCKTLQNSKPIISCASIFIILITFLPTNLYAINRTLAKMPKELESYRFTRYLLTVKYNAEVENTIRILNRMRFSFTEAGNYVPKGKCVYSAHQENFMYYAHRLAFSLPLPKEIISNNIFQYLESCEYMHVLYTTSHPQYPGGYPIDKLENKFDYLMSTQMSQDPDSQVVGSLLQLH